MANRATNDYRLVAVPDAAAMKAIRRRFGIEDDDLLAVSYSDLVETATTG